MLIIRLAKVLMVAALAAFAFLVTYDNLVDYGANYHFVQHVLSMDTTFPDNTLRDRAITNPSIWKAAYATIIAAEGLTCLLLTIGAVALVTQLRATADAFNGAKAWAVAGLTVGFGVWFFGFLVVGWRVSRHVAIAELERPGGCLPLHDGDPRRADFSGLAGPRQIMAATELFCEA